MSPTKSASQQSDTSADAPKHTPTRMSPATYTDPTPMDRDTPYEVKRYLPGVGWQWVDTTPELEEAEQRRSENEDYNAWRRS